MNAARAKTALRLTNRMTSRVLASIRRVEAKVPENAALHYRKNALEILDPLSTIVFTLWARFPGLKPKPEPGRVYYDPDKWNMPRDEVRRATRDLKQVSLDLQRLTQLLRTSRHPADKALRGAAAAARKVAASTGHAVLRQDPDYRKAEMARIRRRARQTTNS